MHLLNVQTVRQTQQGKTLQVEIKPTPELQALNSIQKVFIWRPYIPNTRNMTLYGDNGVANKTQNFEVAAQYQFDFGLRPAVSQLQSKGKDLTADGRNSSDNNDKDLVKYVSVRTSYYFNKNMSTYIDYKIDLLDSDDNFYENNGISTEDIVAVGLVYQF